MRTATTVLNIIQERGKRKLPIEDLYRQLYNPELYLRAYAKLYPNNGAMTQGSTPETVDAMALTKINKIIEDLRQECYRWTPVRRIYILKKQKVMNDNINNRYRQLEMPMRKGNPVTAQHRKSERPIRLARHADDCSSFEKQELSMRVVWRGSYRCGGLKTARTNGGSVGAGLRISID
jgi:hypothetical protein